MRSILEVASHVLLCLGVLLAVVLPGCRSQEEGGGYLARVNGEVITFSEFWEEFKGRYEDAGDPSSLKTDVLRSMKAGVLGDMIRRRLLLQEARRRGIAVPEEVVEARIRHMGGDLRDRSFQKGLLAHRTDYEEWRRIVEEQLVLEALYAGVVSAAGDASDPEIEEFYKGHMDMFLVPETVRMRQIVVRDRRTAEKILGGIRKGENWERLAEQYSMVRGGERAGQVLTYERGNLPAVLEKVVFEVRQGRVTGPVESPYGFHVFLVEEKRPARMPPLNEVRAKIVQRLMEQRQGDIYARWMQALIRASDIRVHDSLKEDILQVRQ